MFCGVSVLGLGPGFLRSFSGAGTGVEDTTPSSATGSVVVVVLGLGPGFLRSFVVVVVVRFALEDQAQDQAQDQEDQAQDQEEINFLILEV